MVEMINWDKKTGSIVRDINYLSLDKYTNTETKLILLKTVKEASEQQIDLLTSLEKTYKALS